MRPNPVPDTLRAGGTPYGTNGLRVLLPRADGGQCEAIKIDGLKLYPPRPDAGGWVLDDEKNTYPLLDVLRRHGVKNGFG
jgi:hypothetical protein